MFPCKDTPGCLEDLILKALEGSKHLACVDSYAQCVEKEAGLKPENKQKLRLQAYIAGVPKASVRGIKTAGGAGYLNFSHGCYAPLKTFLQSL